VLLGIVVQGTLALQSQTVATAGPQEVPAQHFVCNTGYTPEKCHADMVALRKALAKFPVAELGEWTWILVRSADWKAIVVPRGLGPDSPAFTYYEKRETFLEEALVGGDQVSRRITLINEWRMSLPDLLNFAIAHELGHALCNEKDEAKANRVARMLQEQKPFACETQLASKAYSPEGKNNDEKQALVAEPPVFSGKTQNRSDH